MKTGTRFAAIPARAIDDRRLGRAAFVVLAALGTYANRDGWCNPSLSTIGKRLDISRQAVSRQITELERLGYLDKRSEKHANGSAKSNQYRVIFDTHLPQESDRQAGELSTPGLQVCQPDVAGVSTSDVAGVSTSDVAPIEHPIEHPKEEDSSEQALWMQESWNEVARRRDLPTAQKMTATRKSKARARFKDAGGKEGWLYALSKVEASDFLLGKKNGWKANFDFMLRESSFVKVMEGTYDNGPSPPKDPVSLAVHEMLGKAYG